YSPFFFFVPFVISLLFVFFFRVTATPQPATVPVLARVRFVYAPVPAVPPSRSITPKPHSNLSQIFLTTLSPASPSQSLSPQTNPHYPLPNYSPNPTRHHSHIFQKVLTNTFLLFTRPAAEY
ncbi:hypothetical protein, partial [Klebsiella pneumoniae]|uniref:hypothetical protein n=9 Tax=Klebsiella TaxID=570 RepID=UPI001F4B8A44